MARGFDFLTRRFACRAMLVALGVSACGGESRRRGGIPQPPAGSAGVNGGATGSGGSAASSGEGGVSLGGTGAGAGVGSGGSSNPEGGGAGSPDPLPECTAGATIALGSDAVAERLSELFFQEPASDALLAEVAQRDLSNSAAVGCLARDLLRDERAALGVGRFFQGWLDLKNGGVSLVNPEYVPEFSASLLESAQSASVASALATQRANRGLGDLLQSSEVSVNAALAPLYGVPAPPDGVIERVDLGAERAGIFTEAYFLMTRASQTHGSPAQRGFSLTLQLDCLTIVDLPDVGGTVPAEFEGTTRAWYEAAISDATCAGCHRYGTVVGFALEHFDVLGRYRESEAGEPIDASTEIAFLDVPRVFGHDGAMSALAASPAVRRCFATHWLAYALGSLRGETWYADRLVDPDETALDHIVARASIDPGFSLTETLVAGVETEPFLAP